MCTDSDDYVDGGWMDGLKTWLTQEFGYRDLPLGDPSDQIIEFSYSPEGWNSPYTKEDTLRSITDAITNLMEIYGQAYPDATFDIIAHSLGGVVALDAMVRSPFLRERTNSIITVNSPIRGLSDRQTLLGAVMGELGCGGNVADLVAEEFRVWGDLIVDGPTISRIASDSWEDLVVVNIANMSDLIVPPDIAIFPDKGYPVVWDAGGGAGAQQN
ncbi:MAG: hypothetical protein IH940_02850 [Acidobacteria bacterium]|nr:hypothetical protein [Acidobacteriota bacterium]